MNIDYDAIKAKKPWWLPKVVWNMVVGACCDAAKGYCDIGKASDFAADRAMTAMNDASSGADPAKRDRVCGLLATSCTTVTLASDALRDGVLTEQEKVAVGGSVKDLVQTLVTQDEINAKIDEIRKGLTI